MEMSYVLSLRMVFFYLVTTGWIFDTTSLCENSIKNTIQKILGLETKAMNARIKNYSVSYEKNLLYYYVHNLQPVAPVAQR